MNERTLLRWHSNTVCFTKHTFVAYRECKAHGGVDWVAAARSYRMEYTFHCPSAAHRTNSAMGIPVGRWSWGMRAKTTCEQLSLKIHTNELLRRSTATMLGFVCKNGGNGEVNLLYWSCLLSFPLNVNEYRVLYCCIFHIDVQGVKIHERSHRWWNGTAQLIVGESPVQCVMVMIIKWGLPRSLLTRHSYVSSKQANERRFIDPHDEHS